MMSSLEQGLRWSLKKSVTTSASSLGQWVTWTHLPECNKVYKRYVFLVYKHTQTDICTQLHKHEQTQTQTHTHRNTLWYSPLFVLRQLFPVNTKHLRHINNNRSFSSRTTSQEICLHQWQIKITIYIMYLIYNNKGISIYNDIIKYICQPYHSH